MCKTQEQEEVINLKAAIYKTTSKEKNNKKNSVSSSGRTLSCEDRRCMAQGR